MAYLIKSAKILAKHSEFNNQTLDILINRGKIQKISKRIPVGDHTIIESDNLHLSIGWFDIGTHIGEPGFEQRETIDSICELAACSGFTGLAIFPKTNPVLQNKSDIQFFLAAGAKTTTDLYPIAALSQSCEGKEMTEYYDLHKSGAVAFSDGISSNTQTGFLKRALEYVQAFDGQVIYSPSDLDLTKSGQIHEGEVSIALGLPGIPEMKEITNVESAINMVRYTGGSLIMHALSSANSLKSIKQSGIADRIGVTIPYMNLFESHEALMDFDENFKVIPPLRDNDNRIRLLKAVKSKAVNAIVSNHTPFEIEEKQDAFPLSAFGASSLQSLFPILNSIPRNELSLSNMVEKLSSGPRNLLNIDLPEIAEGATANLTLFDPNKNWTLNQQTNKSISENNPYFEKELKGKVIGVVNNGRLYRTPY